MNTTNIAFLIVAVLAIAFAVWAILRREKTRKLKRQFGPEYDRVVDQEKNPNRAEAVLGERKKRVDKYPIRILTKEERDRFAAAVLLTAFGDGRGLVFRVM